MNTPADLAPLLELFFTQRLIAQRKVSPHTINSYRDTFRLLLKFAEKQLGRSPSKLTLADLAAPFVSAFLGQLETSRAGWSNGVEACFVSCQCGSKIELTRASRARLMATLPDPIGLVVLPHSLTNHSASSRAAAAVIASPAPAKARTISRLSSVQTASWGGRAASSSVAGSGKRRRSAAI